MCLDDAGLERALVDLERAHRTVYAGLVDVLDVADVRRVWQVDGHRGVWNWLVALTGISPAEASRRCQVMRALRDLDVLRERLRSGEVGVCQAREVARVHANRNVRARLVEAEELMVGAARRRCFTDFHAAVDRWSAAADRVTAERSHDDVHAQRRCRLRVSQAGFGLSAHGGSVQGAQMREIFAAFVDTEFQAEWDAGCGVHGDASACHNRWKQRGYRIWRRPDGTWHVERPDTTPSANPEPRSSFGGSWRLAAEWPRSGRGWTRHDRSPHRHDRPRRRTHRGQTRR